MDVDFIPKKYPFDWKWFLRQRVLRPWRLFHDIVSWIQYRTTERHHVVHTGLRPGYYDADYLLLHASFRLLKDFVEKEKPFDHIDWNASPDQAHAGREIRQLYHWWTEIRTNRRDPVNELPDEKCPDVFEFEYKDESGLMVIADERIRKLREEKYPEHEKAFHESIALETAYFEEDQNNLKRLVDVRPYLWT